MPHFIFIQQISVLNILNMLYNLHFFPSKRRLFHNATLFGFCITHILNTGCAKIWKKFRRQKVNLLLISSCVKFWFFKRRTQISELRHTAQTVSVLWFCPGVWVTWREQLTHAYFCRLASCLFLVTEGNPFFFFSNTVHCCLITVTVFSLNTVHVYRNMLQEHIWCLH